MGEKALKYKLLHIHTIGCQMNVYDAERMAGGLKTIGYELTPFPESADLIIVNTCAIREKAEQKVFSFLGSLLTLKTKKPDLLIAVGGCVAQQEGRKILRRAPYTDVIFGTHAVGRLPRLIEQAELGIRPVVDIELSEQIEESDFFLKAVSDESISRFITIMQGCDNFCAYCVVPHVRGREISRIPESILEEIRDLVASGVKEVTLLGQNVNSFGKKQCLCSFPELLKMVSRIDGLERIRFTTSHPKDLSEDLMAAFRDLDKLCRHIHLPVQSGSDRILKKMNRKYTRDIYLEKIAKLRQFYPEIAVSSDIIAGFPGETRTDFEDTLELIRQVEYDSLFVFKYSDRPSAPASRFSDKVPDKEKKARLDELLELQGRYTLEKNQKLIGKTEQILVDGFSRKSEKAGEIQWMGRTSGNKIVNFTCNSDTGLKGKTIPVRIETAFPHSLRGTPVKTEPE